MHTAIVSIMTGAGILSIFFLNLILFNYIDKLFKFSDFKQGYSFMTSIAMKAEQLNHHPEWKNVYNKGTITLTTHDVGGISELDYDMAIFAEKCFKNYI